MDERSDKKLVEAARAGDKEAYAALVRKYYRHVFLVCMGMLGNIADAEDVAQDTLIQGFVKIAKLRDGSKFGPWITQIAKNLCVNLGRKAKRSRKALQEKAELPQEASRQNDHLHLAIEKLPQEVRLPLVMYYFNGRSVKAVAEKLQISPAGVYVRLRTATQQLHEMLVKQGDKS